MENVPLSLEERLRTDKTGQFSKQISDQLNAIIIRLESEKRKLQTRSVYEKIVAAETTVKSATVALQLFIAANEK
jgi:hypothetical protein